MRRVGEMVLDFFYPAKCGLCGLLAEKAICDQCHSEMEELGEERFVPDGPLDGIVSLFAYTGRAAQAVTDLKYGRHTALARPMSEMLLETADRIAPSHKVVPVPIHWLRRSARGFNQAELLCQSFPKDSVDTRVLQRSRLTLPQAGFQRKRRLGRLAGAFECAPIPGWSVLLVDDVTTSGETGRECAAAMKRAGATKVLLLTFSGPRGPS